METSKGGKRKALEATDKAKEESSDEAESLESSISKKYTKRVGREKVKKEGVLVEQATIKVRDLAHEVLEKYDLFHLKPARNLGDEYFNKTLEDLKEQVLYLQDAWKELQGLLEQPPPLTDTGFTLERVVEEITHVMVPTVKMLQREVQDLEESGDFDTDRWWDPEVHSNVPVLACLKFFYYWVAKRVHKEESGQEGTANNY